MVVTLQDMGVVNEIAQHPEAGNLEGLMQEWANADIFRASENFEIAEQLTGITLWQTYLFGRFTLPSYASHIYFAMRDLPPTEDAVGKVIQSNADVFQGELHTNNVFQRPGESHSHYVDMREAFEEADGDLEAVREFERDAKEHGFNQATQTSQLWTPEMVRYSGVVQDLTRNPLTTFLMALVSEDTIGEGYKTTLASLNPDSKFDKFKTFMRRHIELDESEHGPATIDWVNFYVSTLQPSRVTIDSAMKGTQEFIETRLETYAFQ